MGSPDAHSALERERHNLAFTYRRTAKQYLRANDMDQAIDYMRRTVALYEDPELWTVGREYYLMLGNLLRKKGDKIEAEVECTCALQLYREALALHEKAVADDVILLEDHERLARLNRYSGLIDEALTNMQIVEEIIGRHSEQSTSLRAFHRKNRADPKGAGDARSKQAPLKKKGMKRG